MLGAQGLVSRFDDTISNEISSYLGDTYDMIGRDSSIINDEWNLSDRASALGKVLSITGLPDNHPIRSKAVQYFRELRDNYDDRDRILNEQNYDMWDNDVPYDRLNIKLRRKLLDLQFEKDSAESIIRSYDKIHPDDI
jgi:hypothetical protein